MEITVKFNFDTPEGAQRALRTLEFLNAAISSEFESAPSHAEALPQSLEAPTASPAVPDPSAAMPFDSEPEALSKEASKEKSQTHTACDTPTQDSADISDENLRTAMDMRLCSIIGEDWEQKVLSDPEAKRLQRQVTHWFKTIAAELGGVKPTLLPQSKRKKFKDKIMNISKSEDGSIEYLPF